jgi:arylsulfatase A-like enzyme
MTGLNSPAHGITVHLNIKRLLDPSSETYPSEHGPNNWRYNGLDSDDVTLPKLLGAAGYRSIHVGKWHLGSRYGDAQYPTNVGFDVNRGGNYLGQPSSYTGAFGNNLPNMDEYENTGMFLTDALTQAMKSEISYAVTNGIPFYGNMAYYAVHTPFTSNPDATGDYSNSYSDNHTKFATMVEGVDISIGELIDHLEEQGVAEDTLLVFLGDNGSDSPVLLAEDQIPSADFADFPIRGKKGSTYEGGTRVPLIICWAAVDSSNALQQNLPITGGSVEHDMVGVEDIVPTILAATEVDAPEMDGYDLGPYLRSESGSHRPQRLLRHMPHGHRSSFFSWFREGDWKLVYRYNIDNDIADGLSVDYDSFELYNLADDPDESDSLAASNPDKLLAMARALARELDGSWGDYGELWPTRYPNTDEGESTERPFPDDPFLIDYTVDGRDTVDSDGDGLVDALEDIDGDGLVSATETSADASDTDGDGSDDYTEVRLNLDPLDTDEAFVAKKVAAGDSSFSIAWPSVPGTTYNILTGTNLLDDVESWQVAVTNVPADAVSNETSRAVGDMEQESSFFRVELLP